MRILFFIISTFAFANSFGQGVTVAFPNSKTTILGKGYFATDSGIRAFTPISDTLIKPWVPVKYDTGMAVLFMGNPYYYNGSKWVGFGSGPTSFDTTTIYQTIDDTAAAIRNDFPLLTGYMLKGDSTIYVPIYRLDSTRSGLDSRINQRVKYTDSNTVYVTPTDLADSTAAIRADFPNTDSTIFATQFRLDSTRDGIDGRTLSNSITSTQDAYFGNAHLWNGTSGEYLHLQNGSSSATAQRALIIDVGDLSRSLTFTSALVSIGGTNTGDQTTITGNAGTATALQTPRNIQGVPFDGTADINPISGTGFVKVTGTTLSYDNSTYLTTAAASAGYQPLDADLTTIAGLTATTNNFIVSVGSAWASRTPTQVKSTLAIANTDVSGLGTLSTQNGTFSGTSSGTNTGDQTSIVGITGTLSEFNTALTGTDFATGGGTVTGTSSGTNTGDNAANTTANTYADAKVADAINDGTTTIAPSQNAVFDALALKANLASPTFTGTPNLSTAKATSLNTGTTLDGMIFAKSTNAVSVTSTTHGLTVGDEATGNNLAIGTYAAVLAIQARNNGTYQSMYMQPDGGDVVVGNGSFTGKRYFVVNNSGTGTGDYAAIEARNGTAGTNAIRLYMMGSNWTPSGPFKANYGTLITGTGVSGMTIGTQANVPLEFWSNNLQRCVLDGAGLLTTGALTATTLTATTFNGHTLTAGSSTFTGTAAKTYTFPASTATVVGRVATASIASTASATSTTTLFTPPADGFYRVNVYLKITTTGTSPVAGPVTITYTDAFGSVAQSHVMLLQSVTGTVVTTTVNNSTTTGTVNGSMVIYAKASVAIQYAIAVSGTFGSGRYQAYLTCEAL